MKKYYADGAPANWNSNYISAYATMHPWEDWAETWAHYLHIIDTLETAYYFGLSVHPINQATQKLQTGQITDPYYIDNFDNIIATMVATNFCNEQFKQEHGIERQLSFYDQYGGGGKNDLYP